MSLDTGFVAAERGPPRRDASPIAYRAAGIRPFVHKDQQIAKGDFVVTLFESGNRDEDVWPDADVFDMTRSTRPTHLDFG